MTQEIRVNVLGQMLSLEQWGEVQRSVRDQIDALRVKCPTCRCRIVPGAKCMCCWSYGIEEALEQASEGERDG